MPLFWKKGKKVARGDEPSTAASGSRATPVLAETPTLENTNALSTMSIGDSRDHQETTDGVRDARDGSLSGTTIQTLIQQTFHQCDISEPTVPSETPDDTK